MNKKPHLSHIANTHINALHTNSPLDNNSASNAFSNASTHATHPPYISNTNHADPIAACPPLCGMPLDTATIAIIGLGYVGLPLALAIGARYESIGFDSNATRIHELAQHIDSNNECMSDVFLRASKLHFSSNASDIQRAQIYIIAVPTPITSDCLPDMSYIKQACMLVGGMLQQGDIVIFESTTYPTCTRGFCAPLLESSSNLMLNMDFFIGYSPERISPGDTRHTMCDIVKITSGSSKESALVIDKLYKSIIPAGTHCVSSIEIAEASKAIENAQRDCNIAFINEMAMMLHSLGINSTEVLHAARTKWNFLPFFPGLVGGHCISVDPYYLAYIARQKGFISTMLTQSRIINEAMPKFLATRLLEAFAQAKIAINNSLVLVVGFAYKKDCRDIRNTKAQTLCEILESYGARVEVVDSLINKQRALALYQRDVLDSSALQEGRYDGIVCNIIHSCDESVEFRAYCKRGGVMVSLLDNA